MEFSYSLVYDRALCCDINFDRLTNPNLVLDGSDAENPQNWSFQIHHAWWGSPNAADLADPHVRLQFFKERSSRICEPFATVAAALPEDTVLPADPGQQWSPIPWDNHNGAVTIAGDAAHSMLPSECQEPIPIVHVMHSDLQHEDRGQGLNNALQDAAELVDGIKLAVSGEASLREVVNSYEASMRPRGAKDVALSLQTAKNLVVSDLLKSPMFHIGLHKMDGQGAIGEPKSVSVTE